MGDVKFIEDAMPGWMVTKQTCRACGHEQVAVCHESMDRDRAQCSRCAGMTAAVTHFLGEDDKWTVRLEEVGR